MIKQQQNDYFIDWTDDQLSVLEGDVRGMVNYPVYSGRVEALCLDDPVCDVIIGNIPGTLPIELCPSHKFCDPQAAKCIFVKETRRSHNASLHSHVDTRLLNRFFCLFVGSNYFFIILLDSGIYGHMQR